MCVRARVFRFCNLKTPEGNPHPFRAISSSTTTIFWHITRYHISHGSITDIKANHNDNFVNNRSDYARNDHSRSDDDCGSDDDCRRHEDHH